MSDESLVERLDSRQRIEQHNEFFSVLLVVGLSLFRLNLKLAPVRVCKSLEHNRQNLGEAIIDRLLDLVEFCMRVHPMNQELNDWSANLRFTRVQQVNRLGKQEVHQLKPGLLVFL